MTDFITFLLLASFVGTILWMIQNMLTPVTRKYFSQSWHYYTGLVPVFFLLGGSEIISRLLSFIAPAHREANPIPGSGAIAETYAQVSTVEQTAAHVRLWITQLFDNLIRISSSKEFTLIATVIWAVGAIAFTVGNIQRYYAFKRSILRGSRANNDVQCPVQVIVSPHAPTPFIIGLWNPMVVLPDVPLEENKLAMILSHELVHLKRGDLLVKLIVFTSNAIHWFNPASYAMNKQVSMYCELSCDEQVVRHMDAAGRRTYGETLLSMLEYGVMRRNVICTSSLCNPKKHMKRRLTHLMNEKKMKKPVFLLSLVVAIALVGGGGAAAYAAGSTSKIPTDKQVVAGANITVQNPDGTIQSFDKDGNLVPGKSKDSREPKKLTTEEVVDRVTKHIEKGITVPQGYIEELPQKNLDALNERYHLKLQKTNKN